MNPSVYKLTALERYNGRLIGWIQPSVAVPWRVPKECAVLQIPALVGHCGLRSVHHGVQGCFESVVAGPRFDSRHQPVPHPALRTRGRGVGQQRIPRVEDAAAEAEDAAETFTGLNFFR